MIDERSEHEPEEYDPEAEFYDPDTDSLTIPQVSTSEADAPPEIVQTFWITVIVVNAAVLAVSLGVMLLWFRGDLRNGVGLLVGGALLFVLAWRRYRAFRVRDDASTAAEPESDPADDPDAADDQHSDT